MQFSLQQKSIIFLTGLYILFFGLRYVSALNYEFTAYVVLEIAIFIALFATLHITRFPNYFLWCVSVWGLLHMMGGMVRIDGAVLYAYRIVPILDQGGDFFILKFDQVVHAFLYAVVALGFLHLLREYFAIKHSYVLVAVIACMASVGVSVLNEIIEFTAVVLLPETGVGGYENTLLDLIFNCVGAVSAVCIYRVFKN